MDWKIIFLPDLPFLEIIVRGTVMYITLFFLLRVILRRQAGTLAMTDLLLITLLSDTSQNVMTGEYRSVPDGSVLVTTIIFWNYPFDWLSFRSDWFARIVEPPPLPLIKNGRMLRRNMRRELIRENELMMEIREQGRDDISQVKAAYFEGNGQIGVIQYE